MNSRSPSGLRGSVHTQPINPSVQVARSGRAGRLGATASELQLLRKATLNINDLFINRLTFDITFC